MAMFRVDPRVRAYGKARIDITRRAKDEQDWQRQWKEPRYPFPFTWGQGWKHSFQYQVEDFAAEVGFLMDVLGLPAYAFSPSAATFTSPDQAIAFSVVAAPENSDGTPPDTLRIQFVVGDLNGVIEELERRGVAFEQKPEPATSQAASPACASFRTPHGICIDLVGNSNPPVEIAAAALSDPIETEEEWAFTAPGQETGEVTLEITAKEPEAGAQSNPNVAGDEPAQDDETVDPFAGLGFASWADQPRGSEEPPASGDPQPETRGTNPESERHNGSSGWSQIQASPAISNRAADRRRGEVYHRASSPQHSGRRGNTDVRRADPGRPAGGLRRKNPFSLQDLPPLPDQPDRRSAQPFHEPAPPRREPRPAVEDPPSLHQDQVEHEGPTEQPHSGTDRPDPIPDEPRYEDLEEGLDQGLEDF